MSAGLFAGGIMIRLVTLITAIVATMAIERIAMASDDLDRPLLAPTPWIKFCSKTPDNQTTTTCHTGADVWNRVDGKVLASVEIIDPQGIIDAQGKG
jgi:invasion protein IalB